jgi:transposase-like protein
MYANGYPIEDIQRLTGIPSRRVLRNWLREVGLPARSAHYPEAIKETCLRMYADRLTARQIEEATGVRQIPSLTGQCMQR